MRCRCGVLAAWARFPASSSSHPSSLSSTPNSSPSREGSLSPASSREEVVALASWVNKDQGIFLIYHKDLFARRWFNKKVDL